MRVPVYVKIADPLKSGILVFFSYFHSYLIVVVIVLAIIFGGNEKKNVYRAEIIYKLTCFSYANNYGVDLP